MLDLTEVKKLYERRSQQKFPSILIFGPPGAGKGTISKLLAQTGNLFHLSTGDLFRGLTTQTEFGRRVAEEASQGNFISDDVTIFMWKQYVDGLIATNTFIPETQILLLDGIPRTPVQATAIADYIDVKKVIHLEIQDEEELIRRLKGRAVKEGRADDAKDEVLRRRQQIHREKTAQLLEHYPENLICRVNGQQPVPCVLRDILIALGDSLCNPTVVSV